MATSLYDMMALPVVGSKDFSPSKWRIASINGSLPILAKDYDIQFTTRYSDRSYDYKSSSTIHQGLEQFEAEAAAVWPSQRSLVSMCSKPPYTKCGNAPLLTQNCRGLSNIVQCLQRPLKHSSPRGGVKAFRVGMILTWQVISYGLPSVLGTGTIALDMRFMPWMKGNRGT